MKAPGEYFETKKTDIEINNDVTIFYFLPFLLSLIKTEINLRYLSAFYSFNR
jgi:hypothetical protein